MALTLSVGTDQSLMRTRQLLLEREGHSVVVVMDERALAAACAVHNFDVAILSQTLSAKMKQHAASLIREHYPTVKIVELYSIDAWPHARSKTFA